MPNIQLLSAVATAPSGVGTVVITVTYAVQCTPAECNSGATISVLIELQAEDPSFLYGLFGGTTPLASSVTSPELPVFTFSCNDFWGPVAEVSVQEPEGAGWDRPYDGEAGDYWIRLHPDPPALPPFGAPSNCTTLIVTLKTGPIGAGLLDEDFGDDEIIVEVTATDGVGGGSSDAKPLQPNPTNYG